MTRPIIALDFASKKEIQTFLDFFPREESLFVKIGMEVFYQEGPAVVEWLKELNHDIFLDLKLHDIPNTVGKAMEGLARLGVSMTNVHAAGGQEMMKAAKHGLEKGTKAGKTVPKLIAVTQLTSTSEKQMQQDQGIFSTLEESVLRYAANTEKSGLDGVVCSAWEVEKIKNQTNSDFICLTPGIRPNGGDVGDQKRVMTPSEARKIGSDFIVVGRPITQSDQPYLAYQEIKNEWNGVCEHD